VPSLTHRHRFECRPFPHSQANSHESPRSQRDLGIVSDAWPRPFLGRSCFGKTAASHRTTWRLKLDAMRTVLSWLRSLLRRRRAPPQGLTAVEYEAVTLIPLGVGTLTAGPVSRRATVWSEEAGPIASSGQEWRSRWRREPAGRAAAE
jgi:hypothetical protein